MGVDVVRTSSLNAKHSCQLFRIAASFSSLVILSSSVSTANLGCLPASSLRLLFDSLSSPRFNLLRVAKRCFSFFSTCSFSRLILSLSFLCSSVSEALAISFSFLSERFFLAASFSSHVLLSSSVSMANLTCLPATTFSSLRFLFNSLLSPCFNLLRVAEL